MIQPLKVRKDRMAVVIYTQHHKIEGDIHLHPDARMTDFLNLTAVGTFLAVTDAAVYAWPAETPLYTANVVDVNRNHVTLVIPKPRVTAG